MKALITDIGYGDTKYGFLKDGELQLRKFPTAVVRLGPALKTEVEVEGTSDEMVFEGVRYLVGEEAFFAGKPISTRKKGFIPTYAPLLIAKMIRDSGQEFDAIAVSVAISDYKREHIETLKKRISSFEINGKRYSFSEVYVFPQGYGIYRDVFPKKTDEAVFVVDIGFNTVDLSFYVNGKPRKEFFRGFPGYGTSRIIRNVIQRIREETGQLISEIEANEMMKRGGKIKLLGREYDFSSIIESEKEFYAEELFSEIEKELGESWTRASSRIVAGGGGYFIPEEFKEEMALIIPEAPEFSNVRGFLEVLNG
ncbi:hypothetical protein Theam_1742 (plasmid) [Thermovibrio ammonificans HB-1]|uniref:Uncharacterized protein n=1 Tax=Thermovibrio ammonificans (strain DSM 15698 / JCM 12110 / HB-1) TaxID=648996 RepID=E8T6X7_THEA1|nr:ParM/StbA family protein [Thermovibrio ammonificans]ADU97698.1 hypothetical protein Theam_1742 [Thermovibrio ammonificans HB-1]